MFYTYNSVSNVYIGTLVGIMVGLLVIIAFLFFILWKQISILLKMHKLKTKYNAGKVLTMSHVYGLPVSEFLICNCYISKENYIFVCDEREFVLKRKSITDKYLTTDIEIQKQAVSNVGGAIAGAKAFGAIGALLASSAKVIDVTTIKRLLIIEYKSDEGEDKSLAFDITGKLSDANAKFYFNIKKSESMVL